MMRAILCRVVSFDPPTGLPGEIRYTLSVTRDDGAGNTQVLELTGCRSHCVEPDSDDLERKAAPIGSAWPGLELPGGQLQFFIVELEASDNCDGSGGGGGGAGDASLPPLPVGGPLPAPGLPVVGGGEAGGGEGGGGSESGA